MSQNAATPPSRPPSSASSTASSSLGSASSLPRVHDHTRPLPPPRPPPEQPASLSAPTSFRSPGRPVLVGPGASPLSQQPRPAPAGGGGLNLNLSGASEVSLQVPRPDGERVANEYVETPFRPDRRPEDRVDGIGHLKACAKSERRHSKGQPRPHRHHLNHHHSHTGRAITKQPVSFTKEPAPGSGGGGLARGTEQLGPTGTVASIICDYCGKCRCVGCRDPPPLPSRWLCDNACFCSAETALDYASCLCCVKGLFYHCADGGLGSGAGSEALESELGGNCADEPCSCTGSRKTARWTCLSALAIVLPCLLCYWPLKGCVAICEACYAKHHSQGCRCDPRNLARHLAASGGQQGALGSSSPVSPGSQVSEALMRDSRDPEKRLLDPIGPEL